MGVEQSIMKINTFSTHNDNPESIYAKQTELNNLRNELMKAMQECINEVSNAVTNQELAALEDIYAKIKHSHSISEITNLTKTFEEYATVNSLDAVKTAFNTFKKEVADKYSLSTHVHKATTIEGLEEFVVQTIGGVVIPEKNLTEEQLNTFYNSIFEEDADTGE